VNLTNHDGGAGQKMAIRGPTGNAPVERFCGPIAEGRKPAGKGLSTFLTVVIRPRLPGWARRRACRGQAGAAGFDAGQIRQNSANLSFSQGLKGYLSAQGTESRLNHAY
jgi:hypothetical protein